MNSLYRKTAIIKKNVYHLLALSYNFLMKVLYFGGIPLSILYGKLDAHKIVIENENK